MKKWKYQNYDWDEVESVDYPSLRGGGSSERHLGWLSTWNLLRRYTDIKGG